MDGVMFAVDGQQWFALLAGFGGNQLARHHQAFLVGEAHGFSGAHRFVGCLQAGDADDGADHEIHLGMRGYTNRARRAMHDFDFIAA